MCFFVCVIDRHRGIVNEGSEWLHSFGIWCQEWSILQTTYYLSEGNYWPSTGYIPILLSNKNLSLIFISMNSQLHSMQ